MSNSLDPWGANERRELRHATHSLEGAIKEIATLRAALAESEARGEQYDEEIEHARSMRRQAEASRDTAESALAESEARGAAMFKALEAHLAWSWAENDRGHSTTFDQRMELCRYAEHLTEVAVSGATDKYEGVPHMIVWPECELQRAEASEVQALVDNIIEQYRAALGKAGER